MAGLKQRIFVRLFSLLSPDRIMLSHKRKREEPEEFERNTKRKLEPDAPIIELFNTNFDIFTVLMDSLKRDKDEHAMPSRLCKPYAKHRYCAQKKAYLPVIEMDNREAPDYCGCERAFTMDMLRMVSKQFNGFVNKYTEPLLKDPKVHHLTSMKFTHWCLFSAACGYYSCMTMAREMGSRLVPKRNKLEDRDDFGIIKYHEVVEHTTKISFANATLFAAAAGGNLDCVKYCLDHGLKPDPMCFYATILGDSVECAMEMQKSMGSRFLFPSYLTPPIPDPMILSLVGGSPKCLEFFTEDEPEEGVRIWDEENITHLFRFATQSPNLKCIEFVLERADPSPEFSMYIAEKGTAEQMKLLYDFGWPMDMSTWLEAINKNNCNVAEYLRTLKHWDTTPDHQEVCTKALERGDVEAMKQKHSEGYRLHQYTLKALFDMEWKGGMDSYMTAVEYILENIKYLSKHVMKWAIKGPSVTIDVIKVLHDRGMRCERACYYAAKNDRRDLLEFFHRNGYKCDFEAVEAAISYSLPCLIYLIDNNCPGTEDDEERGLSLFAVGEGRLDVLEYIMKRGYGMVHDICEMAALQQSADLLKFCHENGATWNAKTCSNAAKHGRLECLKYAHENGCPWDAKTCAKAAAENNLECLKYAHENGCPWDSDTTDNAWGNNNRECLIYALENGCPFP